MSKKKKVIFLLVGLFVILLCLYLINSYINAPSQGQVITSPVSATNSNSGSFNWAPTKYTDKYISFQYPSALANSPVKNSNPTIIDLTRFSYSDLRTWLLTIEVVNVPSGSLEDNSAYKSREINPVNYQLVKLLINGQNLPIYVDKTTDNFNKVAFLVNGTRQATVSLTGNDSVSNNNLQNTLLLVHSSWQWQ